MHLLKPQKIWICWNWVIRGGKRTKVPIAASGCTTGVDESYRCTWGTYDEAVKAAEEHGYAGVGFVIPKKSFSSTLTNGISIIHSCRCCSGGITLMLRNQSAATASIFMVPVTFHGYRPIPMKKESSVLQGTSI